MPLVGAHAPLVIHLPLSAAMHLLFFASNAIDIPSIVTGNLRSRMACL